MRIISGKYRGKRLTAPKNFPTRPTTDMHKEALFNILQNYYNFDTIRVLDLFAGIGNITFEFASRGTEDLTAVDRHEGCARFLTKTASELSFDIHVIQADVLSFLKTQTQPYDLIIADPPYDFTKENYEAIHALILSQNLLTPEGMLVIEHDKRLDLNELELFSFEKTYGGTRFSFFEP